MLKLPFALTLSALLCASAGCNAQTAPRAQTAPTQTAPALYGAWRSAAIGGGGYVQNVIFTADPRVLYAYVDVGGVFRSNDGGQNWRMIHGSIAGNGAGVTNIRDLSVNPSNPDDIIIAAGSRWSAREGLFRTRDGGKNWRKVEDGWFYGNESFRWAGQNLARSPIDPNHLLAFGAGDGVWVSVDDGQNWRGVGAVTRGSYASDIKFARDGRTVYASAQEVETWQDGKKIKLGGGLFRSDDAGETWRKIADEAPMELRQDPKQNSRWWGLSAGERVVVSDDGGASWRDASQGLPGGEIKGSVSENAFRALGAGPDFLVVGSSRGTFYRRGVNDEAWQKIENPKITEMYQGRPWNSRIEPGHWQHFGAATGSVVVDPRDPNRWFFTDWYAIWRSDDAGKSWNLSMDGVETTVIHTIRADPRDAARVHLGMADNGYLLSLDGGESYVSPHLNSNLKSLSMPASQPARLYATGDGADGKWEAKQVWLSADAGQSWVKSPMRGLPADLRANSIVAAPDAPLTAYLAVAGEVKPNGGGVYRSNDGGQSWSWIGDGLEGDGSAFSDNIFGVGQELAALPGGEVVAISQKRRAIYAWDGAKWARVEAKLNGAPNEVAAGGGAFWVAVKNDGLYRVENGAARRVWSGDVARVTADGGARVAIGTADGVLVSSDAGAGWQKMAGLPHRFYPIVAFAGPRLLAGTAGNGAFWMPLAPDAAQSMTARAVEPRAVELTVAPGLKLAGAWKVVWTGQGQIETVRVENGVTLRSVGGAARGTAGRELERWQGEQLVSGRLSAQGELEQAQVALQIFDAGWKQIGWQTLADAKGAAKAVAFEKSVVWPEGAAHVQLVVAITGEGNVTLEN